MSIPVLGFGAGGHAKVIIEIFKNNDKYKIIGLLDANKKLLGSKVLDIPVLGDDTKLQELLGKGTKHFFIGVGSTSNTELRTSLYNFAISHNMEPVSAIHKSALISKSAYLEKGSTIMAGVIINSSAQIGSNVILNTGSIIEHDCIIGDNVHIATGAKICGSVKISNGVHIGAGATIKQSLNIGSNSVIGAGSVVINDIPSDVIVAGVPAKIIKKTNP